MGRFYLGLLLATFLSGGLLTPLPSRAQQPLTPLVLVHGQGAGPELTWNTALTRLEAEGYKPGITLFTVDLTRTGAEERPYGLFTDTNLVAEEVRRILAETGAPQADLIGHSRGGLIVRMLSVGETAHLVRRAVTLNTPHAGVLPAETLAALAEEAGLEAEQAGGIAVPADLAAGSEAVATLMAREQHFAARRAPALVVGAVWHKELPGILHGHDGLVSLQSQVAWPGAQVRVIEAGPTPQELEAMRHSRWAAMLLLSSSPHLRSLDSREALDAVADFLLAPAAASPRRPCEPVCRDWAGLKGHWAEPELATALAGHIPFSLGPDGRLLFEPNQPMTRAQFVYGLVRVMALPERFGRPTFPDLAGHWAFGYVAAARQAGFLGETEDDLFRPDAPLTYAQAATWLTRATGVKMPPGDSGKYVTMAEGSIMLIRGFQP